MTLRRARLLVVRVTTFGSNVNLGNIRPEEVITLETLRVGAKWSFSQVRALPP